MIDIPIENVKCIRELLRGGIVVKLYHYCKLDKWTYLNLENQQVYANVLSEVNDPYELSHQIDIPNELKRPFLEMMFGKNYEDGKHPYDELINHAVKENKAETSRSNGVICFSEVCDSLPMWGHYADRQKGICLEFDTSFHPFNLATKVSYDKVPPVVPVLKIEDINEDYLSGFGEKILTTKFEQWYYEREWRLIYSRKSPIKYSSNALTRVLFGFHIPKTDVVKVFNITKHNKELKYFRQLLDIKKYQIVFEELDREYLDSLQR